LLCVCAAEIPGIGPYILSRRITTRIESKVVLFL
jgi:hypothetical protein